jgi:outer membrane protein OmpA-like peptidoglycan-associated protein
MNDARRDAVLLVVLAVGLTSACGQQRPSTSPKPESGDPTLIVLLPDRGSDETGRATVTNGSAAVNLTAARESTLVIVNKPPSPVTVMSESDVTRLFGDVLSTLPPAPQHFTLYFRFESDELTEESLALMPDILKAIKGRPLPEVGVVGHTDTTGAQDRNFELGLKRATMVRALLVDAGLSQSFIEVSSHGEGDPMVKTANDTYEPRNRRVEITIR